jgi:hypothetical protein
MVDPERSAIKKRSRPNEDAGIPVASDEYSLTVGPDGPILGFSVFNSLSILVQ